MILNKVLPIRGKTIFYQIDGSGRDTYISNNNGGLCAKKTCLVYDLGKFPVEPKTIQKSSGIAGKTMIYQSDGSGRDSYISYI